MKSKVTKVVLATTLASSVSAVASAADLKDTNIPWAKNSIDKLVESGAVKGYPDGTFKPNNQITRAEMATIMNKVFSKYDENAAASFSDVNTYQWFYKQVASGKQAGYISGYPNNTFKPNNAITRAEAAVMVARALGLDTSKTDGVKGFKDAASLPAWAVGSISALAEKGIINGYTDGTFGANKNITRAEAAVMLDKASGKETTPVASKGINGTVTLDGKAVSGATVKAYKAGAFDVVKEVTTDAAGAFKLDVAVGTYDIVAVQGKTVAYAKGISVTADKGATPELKLEKGVEVTGKLLDKNGNALKNATFAFTADGVTFTGKTDSSGKYTLTVLPGKKYAVRAVNPDKTSEGFQVISSEVSVGDKDATLSDLKASFAVSTSSGGGGGSETPLTLRVSEASTSVDPLGDTAITVTFTKSASNVKINNAEAKAVEGKLNTYRATIDGTVGIDSITANGVDYARVTTVADPLNDTSATVVLNTTGSVKINGKNADKVENQSNAYRVTLDGAGQKVTSITVN